MNHKQITFQVLTLLLCLLVYQSSFAQVTADPFGLSVSIEAGNDLQTGMTLNNPFDYNVAFESSMDEIDAEMRIVNADRLRGRLDNRGPARDRRGEPDDAGYFWVEDNEDDGPDFDWIDLVNREGAERLNVADNWNSGELELGFEFPWYGEWYPSIRACSNGWFTFDPEQDGTFSRLPEFPDDDNSNNILAVDCYDLAPSNQSSMWFWTDGEGIAVISWISMVFPIAPVRCDITMQAVLIAETGTVLFQYGNQIGNQVNMVNIGYENQTGELGANILYHQAVAQGTAYAITGPFTRWLLIEPAEGEIPAEDSQDINVTFLTEDMEDGTYEMRVYFDLKDAEGERNVEPGIIEMSVVMTIDEAVADIAGVVTDFDDNQAVEGATVALARYAYSRPSDEDGVYSMNDLPLGEYILTVTAADYLPLSAAVMIDEAGDYEQDFALLHSECNPDPDEIIMDLAPDGSTQLSINISNDGNGPLTYTTDRRLLGDANADPWTQRSSLSIGENRNDDRIQGVIFANDRFYISGANDGEPAIYIFDRDGNYVDLFIQPGEDRRGMKDLAWDGELIWGSIGNTLYGIATDGEVIRSIESPFNPASNLAWDPLNQWLWVSATTTDIIAVDLEGNQRAEIDRGSLRVYGLAFYPDDPDDCPLYLFTKEADTNRPVVHKTNTENADIQQITYLDNEIGGDPAAVYITNQYDIYSWVFVAVASASANDGGDRVDIWQIDGRKDWMLLEPAAGMIEAGETEEFTLTLDATDLPPARFEGELAFMHDGVGAETTIPVTLSVVEGPVQAEQTLDLSVGWSMVSAYLQPDEEDIVVLTRDLVDNDQLLIVKDGFGRFLNPQYDFNNIPGWDVAHGYLIKMRQAGQLTLAGMTVMPDEPINIRAGWQMIAYYPRVPINAVVALSGIRDELIIAKDGFGNFYNPEFNFSNMGDMMTGRGYLIKSDDAELVYQTEAEEELASAVRKHNQKPVHLPVLTPSGSNMSLLVMSRADLTGEIGVYRDDELVGSGVLDAGMCGLAIWGDDPTTAERDGMIEGESFEMRLWDATQREDRLLEVGTIHHGSNLVYETDGFLALDVRFSESLPTEYFLSQAYPNPFNSSTRLSYGLPEAGEYSISVFDLQGRFVTTLAQGNHAAGHYSAVWNAADVPSGIYIVQMQAGAFGVSHKVTLLR